MSTISRSHTAVAAVVTVLTLALSAPRAVHAQEQAIAAAPIAPSWDETSGYGAVEANRAAASALRAPVAIPSWDESSGYGVVEEIRAAIGHDVVSGVGATGYEASAASGPSWDDTSGYGSVEASRAETALDGALVAC